jgi:hypothetical protein
MIPRHSFFPALVAVFLFAVPTQAAEREKWDQAALTKLSGELVESVKDLRGSARRQPPDSIASGQSRARHRLLDLLRLIEQECKALRDALAAGEGHDQTISIFERIEETRVRAAQEARRMFLPVQTMDQMKAARAVLEKIRLYYDAKPPTDSGVRGVTD